MARVSLVLPLLLLACGTAPGDVNYVAPEEEGRGNQSKECDPEVYPCGPYGYQPGSIIENLTLPGRTDTNGNGSLEDEHTVTMDLARYYADKNIKAIVVTSSAEWCDPCKAEQPGLVRLFNQYKNEDKKVAIFEAVIQDFQGAPATMEVAMRWAKTYGLPFDVMVDPTRVLGPYYDINAFPMNMVVRTKDMKIVWQKNGLAEGELKAAVAAALAEE